MPDRTQQPRAVDEPEEGRFRIRTEKGGPWYGARIYRSLGMLRAEINGTTAEPLTVWHWGDRISEAEYDTLLRVANSPKPF